MARLFYGRHLTLAIVIHEIKRHFQMHTNMAVAPGHPYKRQSQNIPSVSFQKIFQMQRQLQSRIYKYGCSAQPTIQESLYTALTNIKNVRLLFRLFLDVQIKKMMKDEVRHNNQRLSFLQEDTKIVNCKNEYLRRLEIQK